MNEYKETPKGYDDLTGYYWDESNNKIHETALIYPNVHLGKDNHIGPYCVIGAPAEKRNPEEHSGVLIGDRNNLTKFVTVDAGTIQPTVIGDDVIMLARAHVGHDAAVHHLVTLACNACVGGFAVIRIGSNLGLNSSVHPRSVIASGTMLGANSFIKGEYKLKTDRFKKWAGVPAKCIGANPIGKERLTKYFKENE